MIAFILLAQIFVLSNQNYLVPTFSHDFSENPTPDSTTTEISDLVEKYKTQEWISWGHAVVSTLVSTLLIATPAKYVTIPYAIYSYIASKRSQLLKTKASHYQHTLDEQKTLRAAMDHLNDSNSYIFGSYAHLLTPSSGGTINTLEASVALLAIIALLSPLAMATAAKAKATQASGSGSGSGNGNVSFKKRLVVWCGCVVLGLVVFFQSKRMVERDKAVERKAILLDLYNNCNKNRAGLWGYFAKIHKNTDVYGYYSGDEYCVWLVKQYNREVLLLEVFYETAAFLVRMFLWDIWGSLHIVNKVAVVLIGVIFIRIRWLSK
jgi:hypothetical protein